MQLFAGGSRAHYKAADMADQSSNRNLDQQDSRKAKKKREKDKRWKPVEFSTNFSMPNRDNATSSTGAAAGRRNDDLAFTMHDFEDYGW